MIAQLFKKKEPNYISFEDMQNITRYNSSKYIIISTLLPNNQECLITNTIDYNNEENTINNLINKYEYDKTIVIYGKNSNDNTINDKYAQIRSIGFKNLFIYNGGLFEWLLLQDIYGEDNFPTTTQILDILKYKPINIL